MSCGLSSDVSCWKDLILKLNESPVLTPKFRGISVEFLGYPTRGSLSYQKITIPTKSSCQKLPGGYWVTVTGEKHTNASNKKIHHILEDLIHVPTFTSKLHPQNKNIDTKNDGLEMIGKCISFQTWLFWGIFLLDFRGVCLALVGPISLQMMFAEDLGVILGGEVMIPKMILHLIS